MASLMSLESRCVCRNKAELSLSDSVTVLRLCELPPFCFLASPLREDRHMVCCQLDMEPRDVTGVTSPLKRSVKC